MRKLLPILCGLALLGAFAVAALTLFNVPVSQASPKRAASTMLAPKPTPKGTHPYDLNIPGQGAVPKLGNTPGITVGDIRAYFATHQHLLASTLSHKGPIIASITGPITVAQAEKLTSTWVTDDKTRMVYYVVFNDQFHRTYSSPQFLDRSDPGAVIPSANCVIDEVSGNFLVWGV